MSAEPIRVVLVDDQELVRAGLRMLVDSQADLSVVGEAADGHAAIDLLVSTRADVVLMDVRMPRLDGVQATRRITAQPGAPRVVVLTTFDLDEYAFAALKAGAAGFLLKDAGPEELLGAVRVVHRGESVIAPSTTRRLIEQFSQHLPDGGEVPDRLAVLTAREREVLAAVAYGRTNSEIAAELFLAEATVKTHIGRILAKLDLRDRVHMVLVSYESGLVRPGEQRPSTA